VLTRRLTVNDRVLVLASASAADHAEESIVTAVQSGGGFVEFDLLDGKSLRVLISAGTIAYMEVLDLDDDESPDAGSGWPYQSDYPPDTIL